MNIQSYLKENDVILVFNKYHCIGDHSLSARLGMEKYLLLNDNWVYMLFHDNFYDVKFPFLGSIGHEVSHKYNDLPASYHSKNLNKFINWTNEVYNDFYGGEQLLDSLREKLKKSISYKLNKKKKSYQTSENDGHPSWVRRLDYVRHNNFDSTLVEKIAIDCNVDVNSSDYHSICKLLWEKKHPIILK